MSVEAYREAELAEFAPAPSERCAVGGPRGTVTLAWGAKSLSRGLQGEN